MAIFQKTVERIQLPVFLKSKYGLALFFLGTIISTANAATITVTIDGTTSGAKLTSGTIWGQNAPYTWPNGTAFEVVFTFDDTKGTNSYTLCTGNVLCRTQVLGVSGSNPGTQATIELGGGTPYALGTAANSATIPLALLWANGSIDPEFNYEYFASSNANNNIKFFLYQATGGAWPTNADWRYTISPALTSSSFAAEGTNSFSIEVSSPALNVYGDLLVTSLSVSGLSACSATPSLTLDNTDTASNGGQPNLLYGGTPDTTNIAVSATSGTDVAMTASHGSFSPSSVTTSGSPGTATATYTTGTATAVEGISSMACGIVSSSNPPVYDSYDNLTYSTGSWHYNAHQSQLSASQFSPSTQPLTAANIQTFMGNWSGEVMQHFYVDTTAPIHGGWYDTTSTSTTETYSARGAGSTTYCVGPSGGNCPSASDTGTLVSTVIYNAAVNAVNSNSGTNFPINAQVIIATMQKENGLFQATTSALPSTSGYFNGYTANPVTGSTYTLNNAMGCGTLSDLGDQITCAANTFASRYNDTTAGFDSTVSLNWPTPVFWHVNATEKANPSSGIQKSLQYAFTSGTGCMAKPLESNCDLVSMNVNNAQTYAQYAYTPFVRAYSSGPSWGGDEGFEQEWLQYTTMGW